MISYPAETVGDAGETPRHSVRAAGLPVPCHQDYEALALFRYEIRRFMALSRDMLDSKGISPVQYQAMLAIRARGDDEVAIGDLADELHITVQSAVELVGRLQDAGVVARSRSSRDRRRILLTLTPHGQTILPDLAALQLNDLRTRAPAFEAAVVRFRCSGGDIAPAAELPEPIGQSQWARRILPANLRRSTRRRAGAASWLAEAR